MTFKYVDGEQYPAVSLTHSQFTGNLYENGARIALVGPQLANRIVQALNRDSGQAGEDGLREAFVKLIALFERLGDDETSSPGYRLACKDAGMHAKAALAASAPAPKGGK